MHKELCVLFNFKHSNIQYCWDLDKNIIFANITEMNFKPIEPGNTIHLSGKAYRFYRFDKDICLEVRDEPKLKTLADAWKVWRKIEKDYKEEFKDHFYPTFVKAMVDGNLGWLVAMKYADNGYRDILFIRADDAPISASATQKGWCTMYIWKTHPRRWWNIRITLNKKFL